MHHTNTLHTTTARLMSLLCALCLLAACQKEEEPDLWIHTTGELSFRVDQNQNALQIPISSNSDWEASSTADWVSFDTTSGNGSATLQISIAANKQPQIRQATVSIALTKGDDVLTLEIKQNAASMLIGYPSVEKGAGYSYDATADYCEGMKYQVFDIAYMDYRQMTDGKNLYVVDDNTVTVEEEFVFANSEEELSRQISANCSVGLDVFVVFKAVGRIIRSAYYLDIEPFHQCLSPVFLRLQLLGALIVDGPRGLRIEKVVDAEDSGEFQMGPVIQRIAHGVRNSLRPFLELLVTASVPGDELLWHPVAPHCAPFVMVPAEPHLGQVLEPVVLRYLPRHEMAVIVDNGHFLRALVIKLPRITVREHEIIIDELPVHHSVNAFLDFCQYIHI